MEMGGTFDEKDDVLWPLDDEPIEERHQRSLEPDESFGHFIEIRVDDVKRYANQCFL